MVFENYLKRPFLCLSLLCMGMWAMGQESGDRLDRIHIGVSGGIHSNSTSISKLDKEIFPNPTSQTGGVFGIFAEFELGTARKFSLRPELMFLSRGTELNGISYKQSTGTGKLNYKLQAEYVDLRVPVIYNFGEVNKIRPYLYVAPVFGFVRGGDISAVDDVAEYKIDVTSANMASVYVAGAIGAGVKIPFSLGGGKQMHLGIEANYEYGFTDTYGSKEKDGKAFAQLFFPVYDIQGTREFSGFEIKATLSVPLSVFKKSNAPQKRSVYTAPVTEPSKNFSVKEKPCYTLDEILDLLALGQRVEGKTICAVDLINFEFGKSALNRSSCDYLDKIAALMLRTNAKIEIKGHTDNVGNEEFNMELSRKRAKAVYDYLLAKKVSSSKLSYSFYGMSKPLVSNDTDEGRRENRRVEFEILK